MYSVLGSQAATRWPIAGEGAKSSQTQVEFLKIVRDTIREDDQTVTIGNMRKAIADTHVILNTAITPGMILVPGDLIILSEKIPGFNNILTVADSTMKFGLNEKVNKKLDPTQREPRNRAPSSEIKNDDINPVKSAVSDIPVNNRNNNRVERDSSERHYSRYYGRPSGIVSTPTRTLTSVTLGASVLSFAGAMAISGFL